MLLRVFAGDDEAVVKLEEEHPGFVKLFSLRGGRRMDSVFFWRVLGHQAAASISAPDASLLSLLRTLMLEPERISFDMHLPSMDEDTRKMLQRALEDAGEHIYKYAAHWYKCTDCGYPFFIGECGRPMQVAPCPACKNPVGGQSHNPTDTTQLDTTTDLSPFGYTLRAAEH